MYARVHIHTYIMYLYVMCTCTHIPYIPGTCRALSDFDGDFFPDFGTEDSPADYCARNSSLSPIALKIGLKVAGESPASFEPMYV